MKILIVDDFSTMRRIIKGSLLNSVSPTPKRRMTQHRPAAVQAGNFDFLITD